MKRRMKALVVLLAIVGPLVFSGAAVASYWFFTGYLPRPDGTRSVFLGSLPPPPAYVRTSWSPCTLNMNGVMIRRDYTWDVLHFYHANGCDQHAEDILYGEHVNYGCSNPAGQPQLWDNCYAGTNY